MSSADLFTSSCTEILSLIIGVILILALVFCTWKLGNWAYGLL